MKTGSWVKRITVFSQRGKGGAHSVSRTRESMWGRALSPASEAGKALISACLQRRQLQDATLWEGRVHYCTVNTSLDLASFQSAICAGERQGLSQHTTALPHHRTATPVHPRTSAPPHQRTTAPAHRRTSTPPHQHTTAPPHQRTTTPAHHRTTPAPAAAHSHGGVRVRCQTGWSLPASARGERLAVRHG